MDVLESNTVKSDQPQSRELNNADRSLLRALLPLQQHLVFAGGAACSLWTHEAGVDRHAVDWIDVIAKTEHDTDFTALEIALRRAGAVEMQSDEGRPAWFFGNHELNIWNVEPRFSAFTSRFIAGAFQNPRRYTLDGEKIRGLNPAYFLALKIEAFQLRGYHNFYESRDFNDLIFCLTNRAEFAYDIRLAPPPVRIFVIRALAEMKAKADFQSATRALLRKEQAIEQLYAYLGDIMKVERF